MEKAITKNGIEFEYNYYLVRDGGVFSVADRAFSQEEKAEIRSYLKSDRDVVRLEFFTPN